MNAQPSLLDILRPRCFPKNPKRSRVTRTIQQPEIDLFEQVEAAKAGSRADMSRPARSSRASGR